MTIWLILAVITVGVLVALAAPLLRRHRGGSPRTSREIAIYRDQLAELQREVNEVSAEIAYALSPEQLIRKNIDFGLNLVRPHEQQVFRVTVDVERRLATKRYGRFYTANEDRAGVTAVP